MAKIIFKCPYLNGGGRNISHLANITNYISTRNGVEFLSVENRDLPVTKKQEQFIEQILKEFPNAKTLFEYDDYFQNKTIENASDFISMALEYNIDTVAKKENYVDYIANRPMVEKISSHGLFTTGNKKIVLSQVAHEIAYHKGNVWLPIIALRREDAVRTGYDNVESWKLLLEQYALELANGLKISDKNFRWYAAFHNHNHHPHIHMICYSVNPKEGFLTKDGIKDIKSGLLKNVYGSEMKLIYSEQTQRRDTLKAESKKAVEQLIVKIASGNIQNTKIENMFLELSENLKCTKGKRVYGYLPPRIKAMVDNITDELSRESSIANGYKLWCEMRNEILHSYSDKDIETLPLSQQKEFKSIKNHIIYEADKLSKGEISLTDLDEVEQPEQESIPKDEIIADTFTEPIDTEEDVERQENTSPYVKWTDEYKQARALLFGAEVNEPDFESALKLLRAESQNGNMLAVFDLGRMYADGLGVEINAENAHEYYAQALDGFEILEKRKPWKYLEYRIGKMYAQGLGTEQDYEVAAQWFQKSAEQKYKFAEYSLGGLFYRGQGVEQDYQKAFELYLRSAKQGFPYSDFEVAKMYRDSVGTEKDNKQSNYHFEKAYVGFVSLEQQSHDDKLQYRLGWMLQNGIGTEKDITKAKEYFQKSAKLGNPFACYSLAKIILSEESPADDEIRQAVKYLHTASDSGNPFAQYALAKLYYEGNHLNQDVSKAVELFTLSAKQDNEWAAYSLGKIHLNQESHKDIQKAIHWLNKSAEKNNQFAQYQLGKLYLTGEQLPKDTEKAIAYLTESAEQGNQFSQYILGKLYLMGKDVPKDEETAVKWLALSAEQGNEYAQFFIDNMDKWKEPSVSFAFTRLMQHMSRIFENNQPPQKSSIEMKIDSKRMQKLREMKMAQGHKQDDFELKANY